MKVLLAIDSSKFSQAAVDFVSTNIWNENTELKIVSVIESQAPIGAEPFGVSFEFAFEMEKLARETAKKAIEESIDKIKSSAAGKSLIITSHIPMGSPKRMILEEAEEWQPDLIILGSHGYHLWERMLLGSVSNAVAQHARCSVLIVRPKIEVE